MNVRTIVTLSLMLSVSAILGGCAKSASRYEVAIEVDRSRSYQTFNGWEITPRLWEFDKGADRFDGSWEELSAPIFKHLIDEAGINRIRLEIRSGFENPVDYWQQFASGKIGYKQYKKKFYEKINDNDDPNTVNPTGFHFTALDYTVENMLMPMRALLEARGERLIISLCYVDFKAGDKTSRLSHADNPEEYAELVETAFRHLKEKYAIEPEFFELILEPDLTPGWRGNNIGHGLVAVQKRLAAAGFTPRFIGPSVSRLYNAPDYFDDMMAVAGTEGLLSSFSYHRYHTNDMPVWMQRNYLEGIIERAEQAGTETAMLEHLYGDASQFVDDITLANGTAWQIWGIAYKVPEFSDQQGAMLLVKDDSNSQSPTITLTKKATLVSAYFRTIREGAVRLHAESDNEDARVVAVRNADDTYALLVFSDEDSERTLTVTGLPAGDYHTRLVRTDGTIDHFPVTTVVEQQAAKLSANSAGVLILTQGGR